ncbi:MAG TPA: SRPBCC family protein, partial [Actinomycetes bacterium]|nr:SRPBCC family protein [Actinomycetes bacterium]
RVWALVNDIPRVAPCMPGAALTGVLDDNTYEGTVAVKLGPLRMSYKGKVTVEEVDEANHSARLAASGRDTKGAGTARANVETRLESVDPTRTRLHVTSDVQLTGKVASFGRGGAINDVATRLFGQFADCLRATLEAESTPAATGTAEAAGAGAAGTGAEAGAGTEAGAGAEAAGVAGAGATTATGAQPGPSSDAVAAGDGTTTTGAGAAPTATSTTGTPAPRPATPAPRAAEALDAGSLVGTMIKGRLQALFQAIGRFFRRLFGRGRSQA